MSEKKIVPGAVVKLTKPHGPFAVGHETTVCHHVAAADGYVVMSHPNGFGSTVSVPLDCVALVRNPD